MSKYQRFGKLPCTVFPNALKQNKQLFLVLLSDNLLVLHYLSSSLILSYLVVFDLFLMVNNRHAE